MDYVEIGKLIAQLGLVPALGIACVVLWRKWWAMVDKLVTNYDGVIAKKDAQIEALQARVDELGEKRLEEYRGVILDYRNALEETNRRDAELARGQQATHQMLQTLVNRGGGA